MVFAGALKYDTFRTLGKRLSYTKEPVFRVQSCFACAS